MKKFEVTRKKFVERKEGEVWEEGGKAWTIKNGIKRTATKMDDARKKMLMPLACPDCGKAMKSHMDKKFWVINYGPVKRYIRQHSPHKGKAIPIPNIKVRRTNI